jgi:hypothetical protein
MTTKLLSVFLLFPLVGFSQTPISNYDSAALSVYAVVSSGVPTDHSPTGANATWTFNTLSQTATSSDDHVSPTAQELTDYPGTTSVAITTSGTSVSKVFTKDVANEISITGVEGEGLILNYITDNAQIGTFPLGYGYSNSDAVAGTFSYDGAITGTFTGTINCDVDAYGTLVLNDLGTGDFNGSVTRLKTVQNINLSAGFITGTVDQTSYYYYSAATGDLVFRSTTVVIASPVVNSTDTVEERLLTSTLGVDEGIVSSDVKLFPNPVSDKLNFNLTNDDFAHSIAIFDVNGREVINSKLSQNHLDVSVLKSGIYFVSLTTDKGIVNKKFIKL